MNGNWKGDRAREGCVDHTERFSIHGPDVPNSPSKHAHPKSDSIFIHKRRCDNENKSHNGDAKIPNPQAVNKMKILAWNYRGASGNDFITEARSLIHRFHPHVFIVMETKLLTKRAHIVANNLFFENSIIVSFTNYA